jgi:3-oxoacyl-[acyl-carrier protein] reductase
MSLKEKVALVTGGSGGIGKAIALELSKEGVNIAINYMGNKEKALEVVAQLEENGVKAMDIKADVTNSEEVDEMFKSIEDNLGKIDILVNNAGITRDGLLIRMKEKDWADVIDTNLKGVFLCTKRAARGMMKKRYGKIINISSVVGVSGNVGQGNYSASKAGVIGFTKSMAKELASRGIRVNAVAPGFIKTKMTDVLKDDVKTMMKNQIPLGEFGDTKDIANLVMFLASDKSDYITGQVINIDGGMLM